MPRNLLKITALLVAVCYGGMAVLSPGLHELLGCSHEHGERIVECDGTLAGHGCDHADAEPAAGDHADAHHAGGAQAAARPSLQPGVRGLGHDAANCSVCDFLAKLNASQAAAVVEVPLVVALETRAPAGDSLTVARHFWAFSARGPPAVSA